MDNGTRLIDVTVGQLLDLIRGEVQKMLPKPEPPMQNEADERGPLYGMEGIAKALHVGISKAGKLKREGLLDGGFIQIGKTIIVRDPQALREIAARNTTTKRISQ